MRNSRTCKLTCGKATHNAYTSVPCWGDAWIFWSLSLLNPFLNTKKNMHLQTTKSIKVSNPIFTQFTMLGFEGNKFLFATNLILKARTKLIKVVNFFNVKCIPFEFISEFKRLNFNAWISTLEFNDDFW